MMSPWTRGVFLGCFALGVTASPSQTISRSMGCNDSEDDGLSFMQSLLEPNLKVKATLPNDDEKKFILGATTNSFIAGTTAGNATAVKSEVQGIKVKMPLALQTTGAHQPGISPILQASGFLAAPAQMCSMSVAIVIAWSTLAIIAVSWWKLSGADTWHGGFKSGDKAFDERYTYIIDNARGIAAIFVVISHLTGHPAFLTSTGLFWGNTLIYTHWRIVPTMVAIPLFSFISGLLTKEPSLAKLWDLFSSLICVLLLWHMWWSFLLVQVPFMRRNLPGVADDFTWPWYLVALIMWRLACWGIFRWIPWPVTLLSVLASPVVFSEWDKWAVCWQCAQRLATMNLLGYVTRLFVYTPYFIFGYIFPLDKVLGMVSTVPYLNPSRVRLIGCTFVVAWIWHFAFSDYFVAIYLWNMCLSDEAPMMGLVAAVLINMTGVLALVICVAPCFETPLVRLGKYSLHVYLLHPMLVAAVNYLLITISHHPFPLKSRFWHVAVYLCLWTCATGVAFLVSSPPARFVFKPILEPQCWIDPLFKPAWLNQKPRA